MLIDGQKYACDACIRGHRVSHCQHQDRQLHKVAPKGRPVSQCPHCRGARKARAQHVACNCAEKGHSETDCPQKKGEKPEAHTCCCSHGARCGCSLKKEHRKDQQHLDTVPEDVTSELPTPDSLDFKPSRSSMSTPSESKMTVFANGHHKPVHKHNDAAHTRGLPYTIPRAHSNSELAQRSVDSLPSTKRSLISHDTPQHHGSITSAPQPVRRVKSQPGSPVLRPAKLLTPLSTASPAFDSACSPFGTFSSGNSPATSSFPFNFPEPLPDSYFNYPSSSCCADIDSSLPSAVVDHPPSVDWSSLGVQPYRTTSGDYQSRTSQAPSFSSYDYNHDYSHVSHPGLTSSSGELSETEDYPGTSDSVSYAGIAVPADTSKYDEANFSGTDNTDTYRLSSTSSLMSFPPHSNAINMLKQENMEDLDIDEYLRQAEEQTQEMQRRKHASSIGSNNMNPIPTPPRSVPTPPTSIPQQTPLHGLTVREAQNYAHQSGSSIHSLDGANGSTEHLPRQMPITNGVDPMWSSPNLVNSPEEIRWDG